MKASHTMVDSIQKVQMCKRATTHTKIFHLKTRKTLKMTKKKMNKESASTSHKVVLGEVLDQALEQVVEATIERINLNKMMI